MADRRAGRGPYVRDSGGGTTPRSRNQNGQWRAKRSVAGSTPEGAGTSWKALGIGALVVSALVAIGRRGG